MTQRSTSGSSDKKILAKALARYQEGRLDEAGMLCRKILKRMPREPNALHLMGVVQLMNGQREDAAESLRRAAQVDANNAEIHSNLGAAQRACGHFEDAEESYRRALSLNPSDARAHHNMGNLYRQRGRSADAIEAYRRACEIDATYADAFNNLGAVHEASGDLDEATRCFDAAVAADPTHEEAVKNLALMLRLKGRFDDSLKRYESHLAHFPDDVESRNAMGVVLSELGRHSDAADSFRRALDMAPDFTDAHVNLGNELCLQHRPHSALEHFERAVALDPACADTIANLGHARRQLGRVDEAIDAYMRALAEDSDNAEANFGLAVAHLSRGNYTDGWPAYLHRDSMRRRNKSFHRSPLQQELAGKRIQVMSDQGLGDELFFLRFLPTLRERMGWVAYCPDNRLAAMLERAKVANRIAGRDDGREPFDMTVSVGDLPFLVGMYDETLAPAPIAIPVLSERQTRMAETLRTLGPPPYLAVTWRAGTPDRKRLLFKEAPIEGIARAVRDVDATVLSLQRKPNPGETEAMADGIGRPVHDLSALNDDLEDMLALLHAVDAYVCVSNTNVHLRAGVGKPCHVLVPNPPEFRWMAEGRESPWFPGSRIYRQSVDGDWDGALETLRSDLSGLSCKT